MCAPECREFDDTDYTICLDYTLSERKLTVSHQEDKCASQQDWSFTRRTQTEAGVPGSTFQTRYVFSSFQAGCYSCPPYQTFQRLRGWLQALSGWSWNSMFGTAVITSASRKQRTQRERTTSTTRQSFVPVNLHPDKKNKKHLGIFIHIRDTFFWPVLISSALPLCTSLTTSWCFATHPAAPLPSGIRIRGSRRSHKNTLGRPMPIWENTSPGFAPLKANNPRSLTSIWAPNDTWRRGLASKYWEHSWVGKAGFYRWPLWHEPKEGWLKDFPPRARASFLWHLGICTASYEHYVQRRQMQFGAKTFN